MRLALVAILVLAACADPPAPAPAAPREDLSLESVRLPPDRSTRQISGTVAMSGDGAVTLDSGGPTTIPLWMDSATKITLDDHPARGDQLREGDLVRAAYRFDAKSGDPLALVVVANRRPVATAVVKGPLPRPAMQVGPSR